MVVGAFAAMAYGHPRTTTDIYVVLHLPFAERGSIVPLAEELGSGPVEERQDPQWGQRLVTLLPSGVELELFFTKGHPYYAREFERRVLITFRGEQIPFLSPEDLILRKLVNSTLRTKHNIDDAVNVARVQADRLDAGYLREHCGVHRVCDLLEDILEEAGLGG